MLSVLSSGTLHLSEELNCARQEAHRLRCENIQLLDILDQRRAGFLKHIEAVWRGFSSQEDVILKRMAFSALQSSRASTQIWRRRSNTSDALRPRRATAWLWLWRRKLLSAWRRAADQAHRDGLHQMREETEQAGQRTAQALEQRIHELENKVLGLKSELSVERHRSSDLEACLASANSQISELQATLRESYVRQFEEAQQRQSLEKHVSALVRDLDAANAAKKAMAGEIQQRQEDLARLEEQHAEREMRLTDAAGELSLAEEVIDDITKSKLVGLRRFYERYNLPCVLMAMFRRLVELQAHFRSRGTQSTTSLLSAGASPSHASGPSPPVSPRMAGDPVQVALESEVRHHIRLHGESIVTRNGLQAYIEGLRLTGVSPSMVTQVVLALLDINLGENPCDTSRFVAALVAPPPWEQLEVNLALWGAVGEPAAAVVRQVRQRRLSCPSTSANGASQRALSASKAGSCGATRAPQRSASAIGKAMAPNAQLQPASAVTRAGLAGGALSPRHRPWV